MIVYLLRPPLGYWWHLSKTLPTSSRTRIHIFLQINQSFYNWNRKLPTREEQLCKVERREIVRQRLRGGTEKANFKVLSIIMSFNKELVPALYIDICMVFSSLFYLACLPTRFMQIKSAGRGSIPIYLISKTAAYFGLNWCKTTKINLSVSSAFHIFNQERPANISYKWWIQTFQAQKTQHLHCSHP